MRRHQTSASSNVLQSSIAINQKKNNRVIDSAMKIMNNALIERLRIREKEIEELKAEIERLKIKLDNEPLEKLLNEYIEEEIERDEAKNKNEYNSET